MGQKNMARSLFSDLKEYLELFWINLAVQKRNLFEFIRVIGRYYPNKTFRKLDSSLLLLYFFNSPYRISKEFLQSRGEEDLYQYGETPLTTLDFIVKECRVSNKDTVFELGSGRGRTSFWLNTFIGCQVVGIEYIPEFVENANVVKERYNVQNVKFLCEDMLQADFNGASVIYLYGTTLEDAFIEKLIERFQKLPVGTKIITISYPLTDYTTRPLFEVMKRFSAKFTWGMADVYLQIRK